MLIMLIASERNAVTLARDIRLQSFFNPIFPKEENTRPSSPEAEDSVANKQTNGFRSLVVIICLSLVSGITCPKKQAQPEGTRICLGLRR